MYLGVVEADRASYGVVVREIRVAADQAADDAVALGIVGELDPGLQPDDRPGMDGVGAKIDDVLGAAVLVGSAWIERHRGRRHVDLQRPADVADTALRLQHHAVAAHHAGIAGELDRALRGADGRRAGRVEDRPADEDTALGIDADRALGIADEIDAHRPRAGDLVAVQDLLAEHRVVLDGNGRRAVPRGGRVERLGAEGRGALRDRGRVVVVAAGADGIVRRVVVRA